MKKKRLLALMVVMLFAVLTTVAMANGSVHQCHGMSDMTIPLPIKRDDSETECSWDCGNPGCYHDIVFLGIRTSPVTVQHTGSFCEYCGWETPPVTTETVTVSTTTAMAKTTTGQRLIVRDKADSLRSPANAQARP